MNKYQRALNNLKSIDLDEVLDRLGVNEISFYGMNDYPNLEMQVDIDTLQELIDKQEKYRWHDLRKNPNDLPTKDAPIIIKQGAKYHSGLVIEGRMGNWTTLFSDDGEMFYGFAFVDKWKYIEDVEDE